MNSPIPIPTSRLCSGFEDFDVTDWFPYGKNKTIKTEKTPKHLLTKTNQAGNKQTKKNKTTKTHKKTPNKQTKPTNTKNPNQPNPQVE